MKKLLLLFIACLVCCQMQAQELTVKSMAAAPMDLSASKYERKDLTGKPCALVKVQLATTGAQFEGNVIGKSDYKTGEYWVYMSEGSYMLSVKHPSFVPLSVNFRDYKISGVVGKTTYILTLLMQKTQKLIINYTPASAMVIVDSKVYRGKGHVELELPVGEHSYVIAEDGYESAEASVKLNGGSPRSITESLVRVDANVLTNKPESPIATEEDKLSVNALSALNDKSVNVSILRKDVQLERTNIKTSDGGEYYGELKRGKPNGYGKAVYVNGNRYEGEFVNGKRNGLGVYFFYDGERYEGQWLDGQQHGKGVFYFSNNNRYEGSWFHDYQHGHGVMYYSNGEKYDGEWKNDMRSGKGTFHYANGDIYEGQWKDDKPNGDGKIIKANGDSISGTFKDGIIQNVLLHKQAANSSTSDSQVETITVNGVSFNMVRVEDGTFWMGSDDSEAYIGEKPVHNVTLSSYSIGETEVTQELWEAVMGSNPSEFKGANRPVENVSWEDCQEFISKLNEKTGRTFRLPTEAEWEYAARGGAKSLGYKYSGSNNIGDVAWYEDNSGKESHAVKTKRPNELGLYDMSGNVYEWCEDWYDKDYYRSSPQTTPTGPSSGSDRVYRGGSWGHFAWFCRSSFRVSDSPSHRLNDLGLRLAL